MLQTKYKLRQKPTLLLVLNDTGFQLTDNDNPSNNGNYQYTQVKSVRLVKGKTNILVTFFSLLVDFIFDTGSFKNYREKDKLVIQLETTLIELLLFKVEKKQVEILDLELKKIIKSPVEHYH